ncbi:MAG: sugar phosphate isomerase/epimerase [Chloroflexi bacterium]|nr:sugar phosphate isomerase/epimerase [Chloroflexota bacterium]
MKKCVSTWSFHNIIPYELSLLMLPEVLRGWGIKAMEVVDFQLFSTDDDYLDELKKFSEDKGVKIVCFAISNDFTYPGESDREKEIEKAIKGMDMAVRLGAGMVRIFTGQKHSGPDTKGHVISCLKKIVPEAYDRGILMALENHGGLSANAVDLADIVTSVGSPTLGICADFGNFPAASRYDDLRYVAPATWHIHAKSYAFDKAGNETTIDYEKALNIFHKANFNGYISVEYEGKTDPYEGTGKTLALIYKYDTEEDAE